MSRPEFKILKKSKKSQARLGVIKTKNGVLHTPAFLPVATQGAVKTLDSCDIKTLGFEGILCNTYHLMLQPGSSVIKKQGGLHKFMNFQGVIATDSGGFQVFSLGKGLEQSVGKIPLPYKSCGRKKITKITTELSQGRGRVRDIPDPTPTLLKIREEGVWFRSHLDGKEQFLSPEKSMQIQQELSADIIFAFDEPSSPLDDQKQTERAMERTHRWAMRCIAQNSKVKSQNSKPQLKTQNLKQQGLFGIIQGGRYKKLRQESAKFIASLPFDGFGIGGSFGSSYGDSKKNMLDVLDWTIPLLPEEKPRHLLGIGHLEDLEATIKKGIDLFDCVHPTRLARHGVAITSQGEIAIAKSKFLLDKTPLDKNCGCPVCQNYSKAYICHLFRAKELTALRLLTLHNLWFFREFVDRMKKKIESGKI